mmetsp:Transcript_23723/g.48527  ORF Transcript_23723/g.48527 Transcript_23723/m.48527 type:complete len:120 (-) Transcript_23723:289-648(-)
MSQTYEIRPAYKQRASSATMKGIIQKVLKENLEGKMYDKTQGEQLVTKKIADEIRTQLKELELPRYKYMVQVVIGEQRGEGIRAGCRTLWDQDTDCYANHTFISDQLFCVATAYAMFLY